ncbi:hypothetical protein, partial [Streptomyces sp. CB00072]|uniref:hypothetical protein n=1 Tax=Streptomyces sp. CB00072 TaxID=1703928 RepID=UPI001A7E132B
VLVLVLALALARCRVGRAAGPGALRALSGSPGVRHPFSALRVTLPYFPAGPLFGHRPAPRPFPAALPRDENRRPAEQVRH